MFSLTGSNPVADAIDTVKLECYSLFVASQVSKGGREAGAKFGHVILFVINESPRLKLSTRNLLCIEEEQENITKQIQVLIKEIRKEKHQTETCTANGGGPGKEPK